MRYFVWLCYDGTNYHGWQVQPCDNSVQAELQKALSTILQVNIEIVGAGRTDSGVHARKMAAHFDIDKSIDCKNLAYKLNRLLPKDIAVQRVEQVENDKHARFSATKRTYHYYVHLTKSPFFRHYSCELHYALDFQKMNEATAKLLQFDDFGAFCKTKTDVATTLCKVYEAQWIKADEEGMRWYFRITANRFLRNMVRAVVGTLVEVGRGRMTLDEFCQVIESRKRTEAGESMPGNALFLEDIEY